MKSTLSFLFPILCLLFFSCKKDEVVDEEIMEFKITRIGHLGDSITRGVDDANYPNEVEKLIPDNYEVGNYGVASACLTKNSFKPIWEESRFTNLKTDEPDIITIMLGTNDCNPTNSDTVRAEYESDYREMIDLLQSFSSNPQILLCYPPPMHAQNAKTDSLIKAEIIPIIDKLGAEYQIKVIDTHYQVDDYPQNYPDNIHPNKEGMITLAEIIAKALEL